MAIGSCLGDLQLLVLFRPTLIYDIMLILTMNKPFVFVFSMKMVRFNVLEPLQRSQTTLKYREPLQAWSDDRRRRVDQLSDFERIGNWLG
jgi:hypothetical protein